jgi:hypothetical protein
MLDVLITVDTEVWWQEPDLTTFRDDFARWFYGRTPSGEFGVAYQIRELNRRGLKAVFFVEPLFACAAGLGPLEEMVGVIRDGGHEVQLHIHTEWLELLDEPLSRQPLGTHLRDFDYDDQLALLSRALENLRRAGADDVCAFRAGNYGANRVTLKALAELGLRYDSSYNFCYLNDACQIEVPEVLLQPTELDNTIEVPIGFFEDWPGHYRHAQITAVSAAEMRHVLRSAARALSTFVIVSHSFELLTADRSDVDPTVLGRFHALCDFLADNRDTFVTRGFNDASFEPSAATVEPLRGRLLNTALRIGQQAWRRLR